MFKRHRFLAPTVALVCVACSARFSANDGTGSTGVAGKAGEESGGFTSSAGSTSSGDAGETENAGRTSSAGASSAAGAGGMTAGTGGTNTGTGGMNVGHAGWGNAGSGSAGRWSGSGGATASDCATLRQEYQAAVEKARACDKGSTEQCSPSSSAQPIGGCGCPVLINAKSEAAVAAKKAYQAYQDGKCDLNGPVCDIYCEPPVAASCAQATLSGAFVCSPGQK